MKEPTKQIKTIEAKQIILPAEEMVKALEWLGYKLSVRDKYLMGRRVNYVIRWDDSGAY